MCSGPSICFSRYPLVLVDGKIPYSLLSLSKSQSKTDGDRNTPSMCVSTKVFLNPISLFSYSSQNPKKHIHASRWFVFQSMFSISPRNAIYTYVNSFHFNFFYYFIKSFYSTIFNYINMLPYVLKSFLSNKNVALLPRHI
jgi:hypothetical protein